jgi:hypothetical protein
MKGRSGSAELVKPIVRRRVREMHFLSSTFWFAAFALQSRRRLNKPQTAHEKSFLFAGDLNEEAETDLLRAHQDENQEVDLRSEVLKAPHHGSDDFVPEFAAAVAPVISVISSGDESAHGVHPPASDSGRGAGKVLAGRRAADLRHGAGRVLQGGGLLEAGGPQARSGRDAPDRGRPARRSREGRGARQVLRLQPVRVWAGDSADERQTLLVYTNSARTNFKEAYAFGTDDEGETVPVKVRRV